jgi:hypothetical protein
VPHNQKPRWRQLPYTPLEDWLSAHHKPAADHDGSAATLGGARIALLLDTSEGAVRYWKQEGSLNIYAADKAAVALGRHPSEIWGELWWAA